MPTQALHLSGLFLLAVCPFLPVEGFAPPPPFGGTSIGATSSSSLLPGLLSLSSSCDFDKAEQEAEVHVGPTVTDQHLVSANETEEDADDLHDIQETLFDLLWNVQHIADPAFWSSPTCPPVLQSLFAQNLTNSVQVQPSTIPEAGLGLFASRNISKGSIISLYPTHTVGINLNEGGSEWVALSQDDQDHFMNVVETNGPNYSLYLLGNRPPEKECDGTLIVDCNPHRIDGDGWLAHRINDGSVVAQNTERGVIQYLDTSLHWQNCVICPWGPSPVLAAMVTRDVREGEELFTSYGVSYWMEANFANEKEEEEESSSRVKKTKEIREKERDLFECYLRYATEEMRGKEEAEALQEVFDALSS